MSSSGFHIVVDRELDIVKIRYFGLLTLDMVDRAYEAMLETENVTATTVALLDTREALVHEIDVDWLRRTQEIRAARGVRTRTSALVVLDDEGHRMLGQLWAAIRSAFAQQPAGVFTGEQAAIEWLLDQRSAKARSSACA